ncbi:alpha-glycosidase [Lachnoclostridium sp. An14]|uniref:glycoside hydrolase family 13 protein n=1 Tax=Lachnoclostridium sp. An14 TaxID=1965562 RepID=UPI000B3A29F9|nr:alpha-glycosidase [Lachnoclostridium sp. An14]
MERDKRGMPMNREALFADETEDYRIPAEPDEGQEVCLRFRALKSGVDRVFFVRLNKGIQARMNKRSSDDIFDYYEYRMTLGAEPEFFYFRVDAGGETCFYNRLGAVDAAGWDYAFRITPGFHTPDWAKGAVMYQIFVDRFNRGETFNDVESGEYIYIGRPISQVTDWGKYPETMDVGCFYGGDLQGVWDKLDYLQFLGVEVIYFNPLFVSPSNHKYDCQDYDHIDPHYGVIVKDGGKRAVETGMDNSEATRYILRSTDRRNLEASDAFFARMMEEIHRRGMRVIIDGVFNHCGSFNKWLDRERIYEKSGQYEPGAYVSADSPYRSFFKFNSDNWPYNGSYDGWWGHDTLPKLNYEESPKLYQYILDIAKKWVSPPYNVDGWRLDVAADLGRTSEFNHRFWRDFRRVVKEANPDALLLAEHYGDPTSWLQGDQWDSVMNYDAFMEPLSWFLTGMEKHSDWSSDELYGDGAKFFESMAYNMARLQTPSLLTAMNELSNHDHSRFLTRTNRVVGRLGTMGAKAAEEGIDKGVFREAVLVQMTWPGAPTIYYGDEVGVCGWTDPDNRRTYPWGDEDIELMDYHSYLTKYHKKLKSLKKGSIKPLAWGEQYICYGRMKGKEKCVVAVNNGKEDRDLEIPVWQLGIPDGTVLTRLMYTNRYGHNVGRVEYKVKNGFVMIDLEGTSGILLACRVGGIMDV